MTELQNQQALIKWGQQPGIRSKWPCLKLMFHVPNERKCTPQQGRQLKLAGTRSGVPDLLLPVPKGQYHGLFIELKTLTGGTSANQSWWIGELNAQGYYATVCHGWESAARTIEWYLSL